MESHASWLLLLAALGVAACASLQDPEAKMLPIRHITEPGGKRSTNDVLRHIGMTRVKSPPLHRKRLASQSRKSHSGDSHVYVIKLPANPYYYEDNGKLQQDNHPNNINKIPLSFKSNGKPGKVYHWNLPMVKKMAARKASQGANQVFKPSLWREDSGDRRVSYYKPKKPGKQPFHKYFPGNGKPHALYVIENKRKNSGHQEAKWAGGRQEPQWIKTDSLQEPQWIKN